MFDFAPLIAQQTATSDLIDKLARTPLSKVLIFVAILTVFRIALAPYLSKTPPHLRTGPYKVAAFLNEFLDAIIYAGVFVFMVIRPFGIQAFRIPSGSMWPTLYVNDYIVLNKAIYRYSDPKVKDIVVFRPPKEAVFNSPEQLDADGDVNIDFIKRLQGTPGDVVELRKGVLYRNGQPDQDPNKHLSACADNPAACVNYREYTDDQKKQFNEASFKLVNDNGRLIPLNYTDDTANSQLPPSDGLTGQTAYVVHPKFGVDPSNTAEMERLKRLPAAAVPKGYYLFMGDNRNNSFDSRGWGLVPRASIVGRAEVIWLPINRIQRTR